MILSPKFQQTLVNSLAQEDRILHMAAKKVVARMTAFAEKAAAPALRVALAVALQRQGGGSFDRQTRTKTVADLLKANPSPPTINTEGSVGEQRLSRRPPSQSTAS